MIKKILDKMPYIDDLKTELEKNRVLANLRHDSIIELNEINRDLLNKFTGCKAQNRELKKGKEILEFRLDRRDKELEECIEISNKLKEENDKLQNELKYYKKALKKIYHGSSDVSIYASIKK